MKIKLICFGISRDIIGNLNYDVMLENGNNLASLRTHLVANFPDFKKLSSIKFAVDDAYATDDFELHDGVEVVIIPPVSGG